ncbi:hypothetical protein GCM10023206_00240 [Acinetobacter puyangensis]|uniref:Transferrin-binding protein B C-lobe/N-lobe beta barrel domain-containing protein n=1 Tax=Acinetobacter puyangensis TaxID=1096779 RepID=A0A240E7S8_9GAMM|nr:Slam-dependent surface lipoprotein [Acinetobacter puyangensis]SNX44626.1 hypothetical protein SAMN05421731_103368 [Acinetobacter puyangensis]
MKLNQIAFALVATLGIIGSAHAAIGSGQSYGGSDGDGLLKLSSTEVKAGVDGAVVTTSSPTGGYADFDHLKTYINLGLAGSHNTTTDVYHFAGSDLAWVSALGAPDHTGLGVWDFKQVGGEDIYFGNWAKEVGTTGVADSSTHTVFYIGDNVDSAISSANYGVTANYTVSGLNNGDYYSGNYAATFGATATGTGTLTGTLTDGTSTFNVGTATIDNATAAISGSDASWTGGKTASGGVVSGSFFNTQAQLAGIAKFADRSYDIAFGGVRQ